jgi:lysozyme
MHISEQALEFLIGWEALRLQPYQDEAGLWTIGIGHLLTPRELASGGLLIGEQRVRWRKGLTQEQALALKQQDLEPVMDCVEARLHNLALAQHEFDALVIYCFNIGNRAFSRDSAVPRWLETGNKARAVDAWKDWNKVTINGTKRKSPGLVKRRNAELQMFLNADYSGRP